MTTEASRIRTPPWVVVARVVASSICLVLLLITIPSLGSVTLSNHRIGYGWRDALSVVVFLFPLVIILIGTVWSRIIEYIGWTLVLAVLILWVVQYRRFMADRSPNQPAAGKAGIAPRLTIEHHWPGLPEPGRSTAL